MKKKVLNIALAIFMVLSLMPAASLTASAYSGEAPTLNHGGTIASDDITALSINAYPASQDFNSLALGKFYAVPSDIGDWHYTMYNIAGAEMCNSDFEDGTEFFRINKSASNSQALFCNSNSDGYVQLSSNAGEFHLISFVLQNADPSASTDSFKIIGYKGSNAVKGATQTVQAAYGNIVTVNLTGSSWYDIDQFAIYPMDQEDIVYSFNFYIDDLVTEAPIVDTTPPTLSSFTPSDNAASVAITTPLTLTFSENVTAVSGKSIYIKKASDSSTVQTIAASDASQVNTSGTAVTITPLASFENGIDYYIAIDAGAFQDALGNAFAGLNDPAVWNFTTAASASTGSSTHSSNHSSSAASSLSATVSVGIGGTEQGIGKVSSSTENGVATATVTADIDKLNSYISAASNGSSVVFTVPQDGGATVGKVDITLQTVGDMAQKNMTLEINSGDITYSLPAAAVDASAAAAALGAVNLSDVTFAVSITSASTGDTAAMTEAASSEGFEVVGKPVTFVLTASYNGKSTEIDTLSNYCARTIKLDSGIDPGKITTAITVDADGSVRHIPTYVYKGTDGYYYAVVNSRTNSTYAIIYNAAAFTDAKGTWYAAQADEMASRKILAGITEGTFGGDNAITRAEFATVIVRALGLPQDTANQFSDVSGSSWYHGYVGAAYKSGIIAGRSSLVFDPTASITREEAMLMIKNAAKLAGYAGTGSNSETYSDRNAVSAWASAAVNFNLENGLIVGSGGQIRPKDTITRAETATVVLRLLQKSELVDVRSHV